VKQKIYTPDSRGNNKMTIVCFISGSGTNYERIFQRDPYHNYIVFTNRPGCAGENKAQANNHVTIELSHLPYLEDARSKYGSVNVPRNCPERIRYEQDAWHLIESKIDKAPDLICLAGYDQWLTDWTVDRYYPRVLNVHPGDTTKGYAGLHWIPTARAMLSGDKAIRSTLFIVDRGEDTGPVLAQSEPLEIFPALRALESEGVGGLVEGFDMAMEFARKHAIYNYDYFEKLANEGQKAMIKQLCSRLQEKLKEVGDWKLYPFVVHDLVARGRVEIDGRMVYIDGRQMPDCGYRMDKGLSN
jgi:folate-dependent phosphoribosylglycinamide formyltransferase PurN